MNHYASADFWACYDALPSTVKEAAGNAFELLKADQRHPSLHFKKVGEYWPARVGLHYRAVGVKARRVGNIQHAVLGYDALLRDEVAQRCFFLDDEFEDEGIGDGAEEVQRGGHVDEGGEAVVDDSESAVDGEDAGPERQLLRRQLPLDDD